jgi:hypothetical protein
MKDQNGSSVSTPAHAVIADKFGALSAPLNGFAIEAAVDSLLGSKPVPEGQTAPFAMWPVAFQRRPIDVFKDNKLVDTMVALAALLPGSPVYNFDQSALAGASGEGI